MPGDLPDPRTEPTSLESPALAGGFLTTSGTWEACNHRVSRGKKKKKNSAVPKIVMEEEGDHVEDDNRRKTQLSLPTGKKL